MIAHVGALQDVTEVGVSCAQDVMSALWQGARKRAIAATDMNEHSSRSHTIFSVNMELTPLDSAEVDAAKVIRKAKVRLLWTRVWCVLRHDGCLIDGICTFWTRLSLVGVLHRSI